MKKINQSVTSAQALNQSMVDESTRKGWEYYDRHQSRSRTSFDSERLRKRKFGLITGHL